MASHRAAARLATVLSYSIAIEAHGSVDGVVHFNPILIEKGLRENRRTKGLESLEWLIDQTATW
jgi:hypothetical protein